MTAAAELAIENQRTLMGFHHESITRGVTQHSAKGPYNPASECCVIASGLWLSAMDIELIALIVEPGDFYYAALGKLWACIVDRAQRGEPTEDPWIIQTAMEAAGHGTCPDKFQEGKNWAWTYMACEPFMIAPRNTDHHARIVRDCKLRRRAVAECAKTTESAKTQTPEQLAESMIAEADAIQRRAIERRRSKLSDIATEIFEKTAQACEAAASGITMGVPSIDSMLAIYKGEYVILGARPSVGKSAFATQIAYRAAAAGIGVIIFSYEMNRTAVWNRIFSQVCHFNAKRAARARLNEAELKQYYDFLNESQGLPLWIEDQDGRDPRRARAIVSQRLMQGDEIGLVIVDHLQLCEWQEKYAVRRYELITNASAALAGIAHDFNISVLALSQLSRPEQKSKERAPALHDLRESGGLEQDADTVCFLHRTGIPKAENNYTVQVEFLVAKQRNGTLGASKVMFVGDHVRFAEPAKPRDKGPF